MYNRGIKCIGSNVIIDSIETFVSAYNKPVVSVGSGIAQIEYDAAESAKIKNTKIDWICVDPNPTSFAREEKAKPFINPAYPLVKDLIADKPEIVGNCLLFLNWCNPNESEYDYEAIQLLQPIAVLTVYERYMNGAGAAGGKKFHKWLELIWDMDIKLIRGELTENVENQTNEPPSGDDSRSIDEKYTELTSIYVEDDENYDKDFDPRLSWVHRSNYEKPANTIIEKIPTYVEAQASTSNDCCVM